MSTTSGLSPADEKLLRQNIELVRKRLWQFIQDSGIDECLAVTAMYNISMDALHQADPTSANKIVEIITEAGARL